MKSPVLMWVKLGAIAVVTLAFLALMLLPTTQVEVSLDMPNGMSKQTADHVFSNIEIVGYVGTGLFVLAVVAVAFWLGRKVIEHHQG